MTTRQVLRSETATGLFFLAFCLYFWLVVDPRLVHHGLGILMIYAPFSFHLGWPFFLDHLTRTGGLVEYGVRLLSQFYAFGWAGALIVTAAAWCLSSSTERLVRRGGRTDCGVMRYIPAAIILVMYCGYSHPLNPILSLLTALAAFAVYVCLAPAAPLERIACLLVACPVLYHAAGAGSLIFALLVTIEELLSVGKDPRGRVCFRCQAWAARGPVGAPTADERSSVQPGIRPLPVAASAGVGCCGGLLGRCGRGCRAGHPFPAPPRSHTHAMFSRYYYPSRAGNTRTTRTS